MHIFTYSGVFLQKKSNLGMENLFLKHLKKNIFAHIWFFFPHICAICVCIFGCFFEHIMLWATCRVCRLFFLRDLSKAPKPSLATCFQPSTSPAPLRGCGMGLISIGHLLLPQESRPISPLGGAPRPRSCPSSGTKNSKSL